MFGSYLPQPSDFFPKLRRGHGRGLGKRRYSTQDPSRFTTARAACVTSDRCTKCYEPGNVQDWKDERGLKDTPWGGA